MTIAHVHEQDLAGKNGEMMTEVGRVKIDLNQKIQRLEAERQTHAELYAKVERKEAELAGTRAVIDRSQSAGCIIICSSIIVCIFCLYNFFFYIIGLHLVISKYYILCNKYIWRLDLYNITILK